MQRWRVRGGPGDIKEAELSALETWGGVRLRGRTAGPWGVWLGMGKGTEAATMEGNDFNFPSAEGVEVHPLCVGGSQEPCRGPANSSHTKQTRMSLGSPFFKIRQ